MSIEPRYFVVFDKEGQPVRYEAGYFTTSIASPNIIEYLSFKEFQNAIAGKLEYKGFTCATKPIENTVDALQVENTNLKEQQTQTDDATIAAYEAKSAMDDAVLTLYEKIQGGTKLYESLFNYLLAKNQSAG